MSDTMMRWKAIYATGPAVEFDATSSDVRDFHERLGRLASYSRVWMALGITGLDTAGLRAIVEVPGAHPPSRRLKNGSIKPQVDAVLREHSTLRVATIAELTGLDYFGIRSVLFRGVRDGDYQRIGHRYSLSNNAAETCTLPDTSGSSAEIRRDGAGELATMGGGDDD